MCFLLVFCYFQQDISELIKTAHKKMRKEEGGMVGIGELQAEDTASITFTLIFLVMWALSSKLMAYKMLLLLNTI